MATTMTDNERLILNALSLAEAPLSKRDVTQRCGMGWATAVKLMTRLEEQGYIVSSGNERQNQAGKSAVVYTLSPVKPAAIGIDIEYRRTRLTIRNLARESLFQSERATPPLKDADTLTAFMEKLLRQGQDKAAELGIALEGGGCGVPSHLFGREGVPYAQISERLGQSVGLPVVVDNNIRCFTAAIASRRQARESLLAVTVRSGIGAGIVIDGRIYPGERGGSGEIAHFPVEKNGALCRCGKTGCLETAVNREILEAALTAAYQGDKAAQKKLNAAAELLGKVVGSALLILDIHQAIVFAELDDPEQRMLTAIRAGVERAVNPGFDYDVRYEPLDAEAYVDGAARRILDEFVR